MATVVKIRGLDRADGGGSATGGSYRGFKVKSALGPSVTGGTSVAATKTIGTSNAAVTYTAKIGGTRGNNIQVAHVVSGNNTPLSVVTTYATTTGYPTVTVNAATDGGGLSTTTATAAAAAVNADAVAAQFVSAAAGGTGASVIVAGAAGALSSGANGTGTSEPFYQSVNARTTVLADVDDQVTVRTLKRNANRWISLGTA